jgi:hypothetical protein
MVARLVRAAIQESGSSRTNRFFRARDVPGGWASGLQARHNTDVMALLAERGN